MADDDDVTGKIGGALDFDGTNDGVRVSYHADLNPAQFTISAWVNPDVVDSDWHSVITSRTSGDSTRAGYIIYEGSNNKWQFWTGENDPPASWQTLHGPTAQSDTWTFITITYDGTTSRLYVNDDTVVSAEKSYRTRNR